MYGESDGREGGAIGKSTAEMTSREFVEMLNKNSGEIESVWVKSEAYGYPELKTNNQGLLNDD